MKLFHISAECYPVAKVGGLADVVGALPKYQTQQKHNVGVVIPNYGNSFFDQKTLKSVYSGSLTLGEKSLDYKILKEKKSTLGFTIYLIDIPELFGRPNVYGYPDDAERFTAFQIAFLDWLVATKNIPKIIHCHDHHTGLIPFMVKHAFKYEILKDIPSIITIHNAQYQGNFSFEKLNYLPPFDLSHIGLLEWNNTINPLATAIKCAWKITTVSSSYLDEMSFSANGLEDLLRHEKSKSIGILNGIDTEVWNPETDEMIEKNFSLQNYKEGKATNKKVLCKRFNLDDTKPLFVFIGRLVGEKGADLLPNICRIAFLDYLNKINILILGSGSAEVEESLENLKVFYKTNYNVYIGYNEQLSHQIYAGADFLLMPSRVEPCGLNQMYALRYGTIPIVRRTGGLKDTIIDIGDKGFGICHDQASVFDVNYSIGRAIALYDNSEKTNQIIQTIMSINHSWENVAQQYLIVYKSLLKKTK